MMNSASAPACLPYFGWANRFCASSMMQHERPQLQAYRFAAISPGDPLVRAQFPGQGLDPRRARFPISARSSRSDSAA